MTAEAEHDEDIAALAKGGRTNVFGFVLRLVARGLTNREIGEVLGLSISTVTSYIARAIAKLQATDSGDRGAPEPGRTTASR